MAARLGSNKDKTVQLSDGKQVHSARATTDGNQLSPSDSVADAAVRPISQVAARFGSCEVGHAGTGVGQGPEICWLAHRIQ
jgi:hypothetical protein